LIYFMQSVDGGPIKIGTTENLVVRIKQLELHYGRPLSVLATEDGGREEERVIHARFAHLRLGRTEQFRPAAELMAFIGKPLLVSANPDAVEVLEPDDRGRRIHLVAMRCREAFKLWLERFAESERTTPAQLLEHGLLQMAKLKGFEEPPKR
jgi:hypothetical protein